MLKTITLITKQCTNQELSLYVGFTAHIVVMKQKLVKAKDTFTNKSQQLNTTSCFSHDNWPRLVFPHLNSNIYRILSKTSQNKGLLLTVLWHYFSCGPLVATVQWIARECNNRVKTIWFFIIWVSRQTIMNFQNWKPQTMAIFRCVDANK